MEIQYLLLDVDGVLTDGTLTYGRLAEPLRSFNIHDGLAIEWFQRLGGQVVIVTAKRSDAVEQRARELGVRHVVQASRNKLRDSERVLGGLNASWQHVAAMGDDLPDLPVLRACAYPIAPANAVAEVREVARYVTQTPGGRGAVREAIEHLLREAGKWDEVVRSYG